MIETRDVFVELFESTRGRTRTLFPKVTAENLHWRPVPGALTVGQILRHIWTSAEGRYKLIKDGNWEYIENRPKGLFTLLGEVTSAEEEVKNLERTYGAILQLIRSLRPEDFEKTFAYTGKRSINWTTRDILFFIAEHEAHHRGQLSSYLRVLGEEWPTPYPRVR